MAKKRAKEIAMDMTKAGEEYEHPVYRGASPEYKKTHKRGNSRPSEAIYQKRYAWWISKGFGDQPASWAARWRLGLPKKRGVEPGSPEETSINHAIQAADVREANIKVYLKNKPKASREDATEHFDRRLREIDKDKKVKAELIEVSTPLNSRKIESNIYPEVSPD